MKRTVNFLLGFLVLTYASISLAGNRPYSGVVLPPGDCWIQLSPAVWDRFPVWSGVYRAIAEWNYVLQKADSGVFIRIRPQNGQTAPPGEKIRATVTIGPVTSGYIASTVIQNNTEIYPPEQPFGQNFWVAKQYVTSATITLRNDLAQTATPQNEWPTSWEAESESRKIDRVILHEIGHLLGLERPDYVGTSVISTMNSKFADGSVFPSAYDSNTIEHLYFSHKTQAVLWDRMIQTASITNPTTRAEKRNEIHQQLYNSFYPLLSEAYNFPNLRYYGNGNPIWSFVVAPRARTKPIYDYILPPIQTFYIKSKIPPQYGALNNAARAACKAWTDQFEALNYSTKIKFLEYDQPIPQPYLDRNWGFGFFDFNPRPPEPGSERYAEASVFTFLDKWEDAPRFWGQIKNYASDHYVWKASVLMQKYLPGSNPPQPIENVGEIALTKIVTHEVGHILGLDHPNQLDNYPYAGTLSIMASSDGPSAPFIEPIDRTQLQFLYATQDEQETKWSALIQAQNIADPVLRASQVNAVTRDLNNLVHSRLDSSIRPYY